MVQNPPYWMTKECSRFEHKGIPTSVKLDFPLFSMSQWRMPHFFTIQYGGFLQCDQFVQKAHSFCNQSNYVDAVPESKVAQSQLKSKTESFLQPFPGVFRRILKLTFSHVLSWITFSKFDLSSVGNSGKARQHPAPERRKRFHKSPLYLMLLH